MRSQEERGKWLKLNNVLMNIRVLGLEVGGRKYHELIIQMKKSMECPYYERIVIFQKILARNLLYV